VGWNKWFNKCPIWDWPSGRMGICSSRIWHFPMDERRIIRIRLLVNGLDKHCFSSDKQSKRPMLPASLRAVEGILVASIDRV
jgi:hypothetical protein